MGDSAHLGPITPPEGQVHIWALAAALSTWHAGQLEKSQARAHKVFWAAAGPNSVCYQSRPYHCNTGQAVGD